MTWEIQKFKGSNSQLKLHHPERDLLKFWHFLPIIFNIFQFSPLSWIWKSESNKSHWLSSLVVQVGPSSSLILTQLFLRSAKVLCRNSVFSHSIPLFLSGQFPLLKMVLGRWCFAHWHLQFCPGYVLRCQICKIWSYQGSSTFLTILTVLQLSCILP